MAENVAGDDDKVPFGAFRTTPTSVSLYFVSISVLCQALVFVSTGPVADYGTARKTLMLVFSTLGAVFTGLFVFLWDDNLWWLGGILIVLSNVAYGASIVFYNAYLPLLVDAAPEVIEAKKAGKPEEEVFAMREALSNRMSSFGFMWGYASGVLLLIVSIGIILGVEAGRDEEEADAREDTLGPRLCLLLTSVWWLLFSIYTFTGLKQRPGPPTPGKRNPIVLAWITMYQTFAEARQFPNTFIFLIAYFIYSDGVSTISFVGVLFGREELDMEDSELIYIALIVPLMALAGNYLFLTIQRKGNFKSKSMLVTNLLFLMLLPLYGLLGFIDASPIGLRQKWEIYVFAVIFGLNLGSVQSYSRVLFTELIPKGREASLLGCYEMVDKGSSWIGPLVVGAIRENGTLRLGLVYLIVFLLVPLPIIIWGVDFDQGRSMARGEMAVIAADGKPLAGDSGATPSGTGSSSSSSS